MNNIRQNLLTYIGYCQKRQRFTYRACLDALKKAGSPTTIRTLYKELSLAKTDELIKIKTFYKKEYPVLTQKGYLEIKTRLPFKKFGEWDGKWRIVSISTPSEERAGRLKLIGLLKNLGFGKLGRNVFISPYPLKTSVTRLATDLGIQKYVAFGEMDVLKDEKQEIGAAWDLESVNEKYHDFMKATRAMPRDEIWPLRAKKLEHEFFKIYGADPHLPAEFLPKDWQGDKAYAKFKELSNSY